MIKVMIAEDEKLTRESMKKLLEKYFADEIKVVAECDNGEDAVEKALSIRPDVILMDIHMPKKDGLTAAKSIKFYNEEIEIVIITANSQFEYAQQAIQIKVEDFLVKPYSIKTFREAIAKVIAKVEKKTEQSKQVKEIEKTLDDVKNLVEKEFVFEIINSKKLTEKELKNYIKLLKVEEMFFNCSIYKINDLDEINQILTSVNKEFDNTVTRVLSSYYLDKLVIYTFGHEVKELENVNKKIKSFIQKRVKDVVNSQSRSYSKNKDIAKAFQEAKDDINQSSKTTAGYNIPYDLENELFRVLLENEVKDQDSQIKENVDLIFNYLFEENPNIEIVFIKKYIKQLILMTDRTVRKIIVDKKKVQSIEEVFELVDNATTVDEHKSVLMNYVKKNNGLIGVFKDKKYVKVIEYAKQYIENNFDKNISLDDVAQHIGLSSNYLSKYFKRIEGVNFKDYATNIRIEKAKTLLESGDGNITEVSEKLGYTDVSYFSYAFKKKTGISPKEYFIKKRR